MVCVKAGIAAESSFARFTNRAPFYSLTTLISAFTTFDSWFFLFFCFWLIAKCMDAFYFLAPRSKGRIFYCRHLVKDWRCMHQSFLWFGWGPLYIYFSGCREYFEPLIAVEAFETSSGTHPYVTGVTNPTCVNTLFSLSSARSTTSCWVPFRS